MSKSQTSEVVGNGAGMPRRYLDILGLEDQPTGQGFEIVFDLMTANEMSHMDHVLAVSQAKVLEIARSIAMSESPSELQKKELYFWFKAPDLLVRVAKILTEKIQQNQQ